MRRSASGLGESPSLFEPGQDEGVDRGAGPAGLRDGRHLGAFQRGERPPVLALEPTVVEGQAIGPGRALRDPGADVGHLRGGERVALSGHLGRVARDHLQQDALLRLARNDGRAGVASLPRRLQRGERQAPFRRGVTVARDAPLLQHRGDPLAEEPAGARVVGLRAGSQGEQEGQAEAGQRGGESSHGGGLAGWGFARRLPLSAMHQGNDKGPVGGRLSMTVTSLRGPTLRVPVETICTFCRSGIAAWPNG